MLDRISEGRTDLVFDYVAAGNAADSRDADGVSLIRWCAYYGDVSGIRFLLGAGERLESLGENLDLNGAVFHGHRELTEFLIERGADVNYPSRENGETPLHAALCKAEARFEPVIRILLAHGADANRATIAGVETEGFMRDVRTKGETALHRAAAFGSEAVIQMLLDAGADKEVRDGNGDSPLTWASWYLRPRSVLRLLCFGRFRVR